MTSVQNRYLTNCTQCEASLRVTDSVLGKTIQCPRCSKSFQVVSLRPLPAKPTIRAAATEAACSLDSVQAIDDQTICIEGRLGEAGLIKSGSGVNDSPTKPATQSSQTQSTLRTLGRYELKRILGRGAFGEVWFAIDTRLRRDVAIKLPLFPPTDEKRVRRFLFEAKAAAGLRHPNIIAVYDAGEIDGQLYLATEFAEGEPLSTYYDGKPLPHRLAAEIVCKLAEALDYAHEANVIHRDLKPHNVVIDTQGEPQLLDFGLAKRLDDDASQTIDGSVLGTPAYLSPEQARGDISKVGPHSDQYSLGVILYRLLAGRTPFEGPPTVVLQKVIGMNPPPLTQFVSNLDPRLNAICNKARQSEPQDRYVNCQDFADDLTRYLADKPVAAQPISRLGTTVRWARKNRRDAILTGIVFSMILLAFIYSVSTFLHAVATTREALRLEGVAKTETEKSLALEADLQTKLQAAKAAQAAAIVARDAENQAREQAEKETAGIMEASTSAGAAKEKADAAIALLTKETESLQEIEADLKIAELKRAEIEAELNAMNARPGGPTINLEPIKSIKNSIGMKLNLISAGTFMMGSPPSEKDRSDDERQHRVTISKPFYIGTTEVTRIQWQAVMNTEPWRKGGDDRAIDHYPATFINWHSAMEFCNRLSVKEGKQYSLPTESQWEYSCRAGTMTTYSFGGLTKFLKNYASCDESIDNSLAFQLVGAKLSNGFGLYDMHGNVCEWCLDWSADYPTENVVDPLGPLSGSYRVRRGGNIYGSASTLRSAYREMETPGHVESHLGFRVVMSYP